MGVKDFMRRRADEYSQAKADFELGCQILGRPTDITSVGQREARMSAGKKERLRRETQARTIGSAAVDIARRAYVASRKEQVRGKNKEIQYEENGVKVKVRNGYSADMDAYTTDIIVVDPNAQGEHYYIIFHEDGQIISQGWRPDH